MKSDKGREEKKCMANVKKTMEDDRNYGMRRQIGNIADPYCGCSKPRRPLVYNPDSAPPLSHEYASQVHQYPRIMKPQGVRTRYTSQKNLDEEPWVNHPYVGGAKIKRYGKVWQSLHGEAQQALASRRPAPAWMGDFYRDSFDESRVNYCGCSRKRNDFAHRMEQIDSDMRNMNLESLPVRGKREVMV